MTSQQITKSIATRELQLGRREKFYHYFFVWFLVVIALLPFFNDISQGPGADIASWFLTPFTLIPLPLAVIYYFIQKRRLRFTVIETKLTLEQVLETVNMIGERQNWHRSAKNKRCYIAKSTTVRCLDWGIRITVLLKHDLVLINSICDPEMDNPVTSFGQNRRNVEMLVSTLKSREFGLAPQKKLKLSQSSTAKM